MVDFMISITRRAMLLGSAASLLFLTDRAAHARPAKMSYGCDEQDAGPTEADVFVSTGGDDSWDGSPKHPVRTINRGIELLSRLPYGSLAIRGGVYREHVKIQNLVATEDKGYTIHRFGNEKVVISALEGLGNWSQLSQDEKRRLGLPSQKIFETTVHLNKTNHNNEFGLNIFSGKERVQIAYNGGSDVSMCTTRQKEAFKIASGDTESDENITSIESKSLIGWDKKVGFRTRLLVHAFPNFVQIVGGFSTQPSLGVLTLSSKGDKFRTNFSGERKNEVRYLLENDPAALTPGSYVVGQDSSDEVKVYFSPRPDQLDLANMRYAARSRCVSVQGCRNITLWGLELHGASGGNSSTNRGGYCLHVLPGNEAVKVINCHIGGNYASDEWGTVAYFDRSNDVEVSKCTISDSYNSFGIFFGYSSNMKVSNTLFEGVSMSPLRVFGVTNMEFSFSKFKNSAFDIHANKFNYYLGCDNILNYGIVSENTGGYATYSSSSRVHFAFCRLDVASKSYDRAIVSQNVAPGSGRGSGDGTGEPVIRSSYYYWNNTLYARPGETLTHNSSLFIGPKRAQTKHFVVNNILFGLSYVGGEILRSHNVYKSLNWTQSHSRGWRLINNEELASGLRLHYLKRGLDFSPVIETELKLNFPNFKHWNLDADGLQFDWKTDPPIGCSSIAGASQPWVK